MNIVNYLVSLLHSRAGALVQWAVGALIGWLTSLATAASITVDPAQWQKLEAALVALGAFVVTFVVQWYQSKQTQKVQKALGVDADGWVGKQTVTAAQAK